jgi:putative ABC transport system substrate-binding protein
MQRRDFIKVAAAGAATAWPLVARAQRAAKLPTIGVLGTTSPTAWGPWNAAFLQRLGELGWTAGRTVAIEYRWAEGRDERYVEIAAEFIRLKVDVIFTSGGGVRTAKEATPVIPIVFALATDPVANGLVASLARPGGNVTGVSGLSTGSKRLELLREIVPGLHRIAMMANIGNPNNTRLERRYVQEAAAALGLELAMLDVRKSDDIATGIEALKGHVDALYVVADPLTSTNRVRINTLAVAARLPTTYNFREDVEAGGLMSYGPNVPDLFRRAAELVDKILRGTKPADIPVEQPTKFDLVINLTTAKALGLTIPESFLLRADQIIE